MKRSILLLISALALSWSLNAAETYTVNWSVNGNIVSTFEQLEGTMIVELPETPTACDADGYMFAGWSDQQITGSQSWAPNLYTDASEMPLVNGNVTYYAVFNSVAGAGGGTYETVDMLTYETIGVTSTSYTEWSDKMATSTAVYAGNTAGGNSSIQLRSSNNNSGIVTTATGGMATKITVEWGSNTTTGRTINVYGKNEPYASASDLYNGSEGTLIGTIVYGTSTELLLDESYEYIGLRSASSALYLTSVSIVWSTPGAGGMTEYVTSCGSSGGSGGNTGGDVTSGTFSGGKTWEILSGSTLYIAGGGSIDGFTTPEDAPWYNYSSSITTLYLNADYFSIGDYVFYSLNNLATIQSPSTYMPTLTDNSFNTGSLGKHITVNIRDNLKSQYESDPVWGLMNVYGYYADSGSDPVAGDEFTVYWSVNGSIESTTSVEAYEFIDALPETPTACDADGYMFAGWSDVPTDGLQSWRPTNLYNYVSEFPSVTQDITYYAVFSKDATAGGGTYEVVDVLNREMTGQIKTTVPATK